MRPPHYVSRANPLPASQCYCWYLLLLVTCLKVIWRHSKCLCLKVDRGLPLLESNLTFCVCFKRTLRRGRCSNCSIIHSHAEKYRRLHFNAGRKKNKTSFLCRLILQENLFFFSQVNFSQYQVNPFFINSRTCSITKPEKHNLNKLDLTFAVYFCNQRQGYKVGAPFSLFRIRVLKLP